MHLFFIRHGQSANNQLWEQTGSSRGRSSDPELTEIGHEQARLLGAYIRHTDDAARGESRGQAAAAGDEPARPGPLGSEVINSFRRDYFGFTHLYTSLMIRSILTGTYVAQESELPLRGWVDIHETGGIYLDDEITGLPQGLPGQTREYLSRRFAHLVLPNGMRPDGWWNRGFETDLERPERGRRVLLELLARHGGTNDRVALISHGAFYNHLMRAIFGGDTGRTWWMMNNTGITRVDFSNDGERTMLIYHNRTDHLPERLIT